jgi:phosphomannomutase
MKQKLSKKYKSVNTMDGIRIDFPDQSWILIRASNTAPLIRLSVETSSKDRMEELSNEFYEILKNEVSNEA